MIRPQQKRRTSKPSNKKNLPFRTEVYQSTYRALQLGIRSFFLKEMKILELQEAILPAVLGNLVGKLFV